MDVAACAQEIVRARKLMSQSLCDMLEIDVEGLERLIGWAAANHDVGKLSPTFQRQDALVSMVADSLGVGFVDSQYDVRHDSLGWELWNHLESRVISKEDKRAARVIMRCSTGHHGTPPSKAKSTSRVLTKFNVKKYFNETDVDQAAQWIQWGTSYFKPVFPDPSKLEKASWWIAGLITLADWVGSNMEWFPYESEGIDRAQYMERARIKAKQAVAASGLDQSMERRNFETLFQSFNPTPVQLVIKTLPTADAPFFLVVEETTGGGKTEAALCAAGGSNFFFGLPSMATANSLWSRISAISGQQVLMHSKSWTLPDSMDRASAWLSNGGRKALLSDIGVGTVDQAMVAVLYARYATLRLAGLIGKTLIIDEVHAYDAYMKEILETLVSMHARSGGSVILLSATMPLVHRSSYMCAWCVGRGIAVPAIEKDSFPLVTFANDKGFFVEADQIRSRYELANGAGRRVIVQHASNYQDVIHRIAQEAAAGKCVVWIRNTVAEAVQAHRDLSMRCKDVMIFHSRFTVGDRARVEADVLREFGKESTAEDRRGKILIATQVVEQSLDLDFDFLVTDLCPIDLLIQRGGRLHRHDRGDRGDAVMLVYGPILTNHPPPDWIPAWSIGSSYVYKDHSKLWATQQIIGTGFVLPRDARWLVESIYGDTNHALPVPPALIEIQEKSLDSEFAKSSAGINAAISPFSNYEKQETQSQWDDLNAQTRLADPSQEWIIFENGLPVHTEIELSCIQIPKRKLIRVFGAENLKVGKFQMALNLSGGFAQGLCGNKPVRISYSSKTGLTID